MEAQTGIITQHVTGPIMRRAIGLKGAIMVLDNLLMKVIINHFILLASLIIIILHLNENDFARIKKLRNVFQTLLFVLNCSETICIAHRSVSRESEKWGSSDSYQIGANS